MDWKAIANGKHILLLEGYARQCLPFMREFKKLGMEVSILCHTKMDCGYASRLPDHKILGICNPEQYEKSEKYFIFQISFFSTTLFISLVTLNTKSIIS